MTSFIPVSSPLIDHQDIDAVGRALKDGQISGTSQIVFEFEKQFADYVGRRFAVAVSNGTNALEMALRVADIGPGDEVILPSFAIISVLLAVKKTGATPIFVDCSATHWNAVPEEIISCITPLTKAIVVVHTYGLPVDVDPIISHIRDSNIKLIEDASEAHGLEYKGKRCGSFGFISTFSFYANKHVTTGEGGMVLTDSESLALRVRNLCNLAMNPERRFVHSEFGENYRLGGLQSALGISQLKKINRIRNLKKLFAEKYDSELANLESLTVPMKALTYAHNDYWVYGVIPKVTPKRSAEIQQSLLSFGIETRPFFYPLHQQPLSGLKSSPGHYPNSSTIGERGFYLPTPLNLTEGQIEFICEKLRDLL